MKLMIVKIIKYFKVLNVFHSPYEKLISKKACKSNPDSYKSNLSCSKFLLNLTDVRQYLNLSLYKYNIFVN